MRLLILAILGSASASRLGEHNTGHHHAAGTFNHHAVNTGSTSDPHSAVFTHLLVDTVSTEGCSKDCPRKFNPVCGSDGRAYNNPCMFEIAHCNQNELAEVECGTQNPRINPGVGLYSGLQSDSPKFLWRATYSAAFVIDGQIIIFPNSQAFFRGNFLAIGESGEFSIETHFVTLGTGEKIQVNEGTVNVIRIPTDAQAILSVLAKTGITMDQFIQLKGALSPEQRFYEITASVIAIDGSYRNINTGVIKIVSLEILQVFNHTDKETQPPVDLATELVQTVTVAETAAHETETVFEPVTLIKTQTRDKFVTVTSPVYNTIAVTITNLVRETVTVPEEQVIRSPVAGSLVVNTIPVPFQTVLTVTNRATNLNVRTITEQIVNPHDHYVTNYSIGTVTVNNPVTSTVVQTITQTSVATTYLTSTVISTVYTTTTEVIYIGGTTTPVGAY